MPDWLQQRRWSLAILAALLLLSLALPQAGMSLQVLQPPGTQHWLGTDALGRDVLLTVLKALPNTLLIALATGVLPVLIALLLTALAYWLGAWMRELLLKLVDILLILPSTLLLIVLAAFLQPDLWGCILLVSLLAWPDDFRVLGSALQKDVQRDNVQLARSYGASKGYVLRVHIWPALSSLLFALVLQNARRGVGITAGLAFLGLMDPRIANFGSLLFESQRQMHSAAFWWLLLPPMLALACLLIFLIRLQAQQVPDVR